MGEALDGDARIGVGRGVVGKVQVVDEADGVAVVALGGLQSGHGSEGGHHGSFFGHGATEHGVAKFAVSFVERVKIGRSVGSKHDDNAVC